MGSIRRRIREPADLSAPATDPYVEPAPPPVGLKWRGTDISQLDNAALLDAMRKTIDISRALWNEVAKRKLIKEV